MNAAFDAAPGRLHEGRPTLVLLPGLDGTDVFLGPLARSLAAALTVRIVELPQDGPQTYEVLTSRVTAATADLPSMVLLGFSFGGPIAIALARACPDRCVGLILAATFVRPPRPRLHRWQFLTKTPTIWLLRFLRRLPGWILRGPTDARREAKSETWRRTPAGVVARRARTIAAVDGREDLASTTQPLLIVAFADDEAVPEGCAVEIGAVRGGELIRLPGQHLAMFDDPAPMQRAVLQFVERLPLERRSPGRDQDA